MTRKQANKQVEQFVHKCATAESEPPVAGSAICSVDSLVAAIEGNYAGMAHSDLVMTCQMLERGRAAWRADAERMKPVIEHYLKRAKHLRDQSEIDRCESALNPPNSELSGPAKPEPK